MTADTIRSVADTIRSITVQLRSITVHPAVNNAVACTRVSLRREACFDVKVAQ